MIKIPKLVDKFGADKGVLVTKADSPLLGTVPKEKLASDVRDSLDKADASISEVMTDGTLAGNGTAGNPLKILGGASAVLTDGITILGDGTPENKIRAATILWRETDA